MSEGLDRIMNETLARFAANYKKAENEEDRKEANKYANAFILGMRPSEYDRWWKTYLVARGDDPTVDYDEEHHVGIRASQERQWAIRRDWGTHQ